MYPGFTLRSKSNLALFKVILAWKWQTAFYLHCDNYNEMNIPIARQNYIMELADGTVENN